MKVWLDDERPKPKAFDLHVTKALEAIELLKTGLVTHISLDHDLGEELSGYDVACWIERAAFDGRLGPIEVTLHSQNSVGKQRMKMAIRKAKEFWNAHDR